MNKKIIAGLIAILAIGGGVYYVTSQNKVASDGHTDHTHDATTEENVTGIHMSAPDGATIAGTRVIVKNSSFKAGNQVLSFELYGKDGHAFGDTELKVAHEKKMHFILVSSDFSDYQHLHPAFKDSAWQTDAVLKNNTVYQAYVDIDSDEDGAEVLRFPIVVGTPVTAVKVSQKETSLSKSGVEVKMEAENGFVAGKANLITFSVSKSGKAIAPENYLGAKGHVVALGENPNTFIHGHPDEDGDSDVHFSFTFETAGTYTLFAQFQLDGVVRTYPFTVQVNAPTAGTTNEAEPHADAVPHN
jgi:hypothetical protein